MPITPFDYKRRSGRSHDYRPDGVNPEDPKQISYEMDRELEDGDPFVETSWATRDNADQPPNFEEGVSAGNLAEIITWVTDTPLGIRRKILEVLSVGATDDARPIRRIFGHLWVEGDVNVSGTIYGPTEINGTNDNIFTIDADATDDIVDKVLRFYRGPSLGYAWLKWDYSLERFRMNFPLDVPQLLINGVPIGEVPSLERQELARFEAWECSNEDEIDPFTIFLDVQRGMIYDIAVEGTPASCCLAIQHRIGTEFDSLLGTNDLTVSVLRSPVSGTECSITTYNQSGSVMGSIPAGAIAESWTSAVKTVNCTSNPPTTGQIVTTVIEFSVLTPGTWIKITIPTFRYNRYGP